MYRVYYDYDSVCHDMLQRVRVDGRCGSHVTTIACICVTMMSCDENAGERECRVVFVFGTCECAACKLTCVIMCVVTRQVWLCECSDCVNVREERARACGFRESCQHVAR